MVTRVLSIDPLNPQKKSIDGAARVLRDGGLVAFPTETVYGLGANFLDKRAVERVYEVKKRPREKPLTVHIVDKDCIQDFACNIPRIFYELSHRFWPGPLTLILEAKAGGKIGFRMPANRIARDLIARSKVPVVAPSANLSDKTPPTSAKEVVDTFNNLIEMVIDGGNTEIGVESTVLDLTVSPFKILREGALGKEKLSSVL